MSATRDKSQKVSFVYSNLYQLYKKGKDAARQATPPSPISGQVIKAENATATHRAYTPVEILGRRVARPASLPKVAPAPIQPSVRSDRAAVDGLKENLKTLNDLHSRLRFMLQELEDLVKE